MSEISIAQVGAEGLPWYAEMGSEAFLSPPAFTDDIGAAGVGRNSHWNRNHRSRGSSGTSSQV